MELRLHADDLKQLEDMFSRALSRAAMTVLRMANKEGLLGAFTRTAEQPEAKTPTVEPAPPVQTPDQPTPPPVVVTPDKPAKQPVAKVKAARRSIRQVCKTVGARPTGYVTVHDAVKLIDGLTPEAAYHQIARWALDQEVKAVIVADNKWTPTKGLPGRLMVENDSVKAREKIRQTNLRAPAGLRQPAPKLLEQHAA